MFNYFDMSETKKLGILLIPSYEIRGQLEELTVPLEESGDCKLLEKPKSFQIAEVLAYIREHFTEIGIIIASAEFTDKPMREWSEESFWRDGVQVAKESKKLGIPGIAILNESQPEWKQSKQIKKCGAEIFLTKDCKKLEDWILDCLIKNSVDKNQLALSEKID